MPDPFVGEPGEPWYRAVLEAATGVSEGAIPFGGSAVLTGRLKPVPCRAGCLVNGRWKMFTEKLITSIREIEHVKHDIADAIAQFAFAGEVEAAAARAVAAAGAGGESPIPTA